MICIGCLLIAMLFADFITKDSLTQSNEMLHEQQVEYYAAVIDSWLQENTRDVDAACSYFETLRAVDDASIRAYMEQLTKNNDNAGDINVGFGNKQFIDGTGWYPDADWDCTGRPWYTDAVAAGGEKYFGEPYIDAVTGNMVISVSKSFKMASGMEGVVNMDLMLSTLFDTMNEIIDSQDGSYGFLTNSSGIILMHPNSEFLADGEIQHSTSDVLNGEYEVGIETGMAIQDYDGISKYVKSSDISSNNWKEVLVIPASSYNDSINQISLVLVIVTILAVLITAVVVVFYAGSITKPISRIQKQIDHLQELNLKDIEVANIRQKDELGKMNRAVLDLQKTLSSIIQQMDGSTATLSTQFDNLNGSVSSLIKNNTIVKQTINEIFSAIEEEAEQVQDANISLSDFAEEINKIVTNAETMNHSASKTMDHSLSGVKSIELLSNQIGKTREIQDEAYQTVSHLEERSKTIDDISQTISDIAEQTSLLALNASIEAARAGEVGKGFAVVAEEIGKLAHATSKATTNITSIITEIQTEIGVVSGQMFSMKDETVKCMDAMDATRDVFEQINREITEVGSGIHQLESAVEVLNNNKEKIVDQFSDISSETQELSASSQNIMVKVEDQNEEMLKIENAVQELSQVIVQLNDIMDQFTI
ncbi:MAG: methyl-accepting chemotaxis protein [Lachnospiraceae bacterium]|nr:methyl-accepting chemotaxis protein [Lachnospiraceae bacterium]